MNETPKLPQTVSYRLWDAMAEACGGPFADSYLSGATETGGKLTTKTQIAFERLSQRGAAMAVLTDLGIELRAPDIAEPVQEYDRMTIAEKIRHHMILATAANMEAGPMWRGGIKGGPRQASEMPASWHEWKAKAAFHFDEIRRLRDWKAEARIVLDRAPPEPRAPGRSTHGPVDETGITREMRAAMARRG